MATQGAFTAIAEVEAGSVNDLHALLNGIGENLNPKVCPIPFQDLTTVHFMRWVILDESKDARGRPVPPSLALSTNYDEPLDPHLAELVAVTGPMFDAIYGHCKGYAAKTPEERVRFLKAHAVGYAAFYVGTRG